MKGDPQGITHLQAQLKNELTAKENEGLIGEMKHADQVMDRIQSQMGSMS